jgi:Contact-dependent growth inhibition CdiA C-terminal domain
LKSDRFVKRASTVLDLIGLGGVRNITLGKNPIADDAANLGVKTGNGSPTNAEPTGNPAGAIDKVDDVINLPKTGTLSGDLGTINPVERNMVQELLNQGKDVELIPRGTTKTPDFKIDGISTELKTLENAGTNTLKNNIQKAAEQGQQILIDARNVEITAENARQQILRAQGNLSKNGKGTLEGRVTVLTKDGIVSF